MMAFKKSSFVLLVLFIVLSGVLIGSIYHFSNRPDDPQGSFDSFKKEREINTPWKLWLNGYLGLYFRLRWVGALNWLALPLAAVFMWTMRKRRPWEMALFIVYFLSVALIAVFGYFNGRYALTLVPFTIAAVLLVGWDIISAGPRLTRIGIFPVLAGLILLNFFKFYPEFKDLYNRIDRSNPDDLPRSILKYLDQIGHDSETNILVYNAPLFYYFTQKKGLTYRNRTLTNKPGIITQTGVDNIFQEPAKDVFVRKEGKEPDAKAIAAAFDTLKNRYRMKYIFSGTLSYDSKELSELIFNGCVPVLNENGYSLFQFKEAYSHPLTPAMDSNRTPPPYRILYSSQDSDPAWAAFRAFDHKINYVGWQSAVGKAGYIGFDFGPGQKRVVNHYSLICTELYTSYMPKDWTFEGSQDHLTWTILHQDDNQTGWKKFEEREFFFANDTPYRYYRVNIASNNGGDNIIIGEIRLLYNKELR